MATPAARPAAGGTSYGRALPSKSPYTQPGTVGVAQLVELRVVVSAVAGSSPVAHPPFYMNKFGLATTLLVVALLSGCGSSMDHNSHKSTTSSGMPTDQSHSASAMPAGQMSDSMFTAEMIPHHQAAIDMAALAPARSEHAEIKQLADAIATAQASEITLMKSVGKANGWDPNAKMQHAESDGMSKHEMGMDMDTSKLKSAKPFDKAFIEMMIPHHEGAILMAKHELARGSNADIRALGNRIIASQTEQIKQMKRWYQAWYHTQLP